MYCNEGWRDIVIYYVLQTAGHVDTAVQEDTIFCQCERFKEFSENK